MPALRLDASHPWATLLSFCESRIPNPESRFPIPDSRFPIPGERAPYVSILLGGWGRIAD